MHLDTVILSSAIIPGMANKDRFPLDFFEFGESILAVTGSFFRLRRPMRCYFLLFEKLRLQNDILGLNR